MSKKTKKTIVNQLTPKDYFRQKAKDLPLHKCLINSDWKSSKLASVLVSRKHNNGNISAAMFLVDLGCLGVKDTFTYFNLPESEFENLMEKINDRMEMSQISYALAHNIILTGVEFAADFGFHPHPEFISTTQFLLEDDTDDIELIEIECGFEGKPAYVRSPGHTPADVKRILFTLEKNAGPGNYFMLDGY